jgi:hypothetical protein
MLNSLVLGNTRVDHRLPWLLRVAMALVARLVALVTVMATVPLMVVLPTASRPGPILDLPRAPSAGYVSRSTIRLRHVGTGMKRMPQSINAMQCLLPPPTVTISGTWTPVLLTRS